MNSDPVRWMAQTVHQAYHKDGTCDECKNDTCVSAKRWIKDFLKDEPIWVDANKRVTRIREMEDSHLYNAYKYVKKKAAMAITEAHRAGSFSTIPSEIASISFPIMNDLKAEIIKREAAKLEKYEGTRNLDL